METLADILKPIKLLRGSHANTGVTGQGCFMNVASYLNGDIVVTDRPPCVCPLVRSVAVWVNDLMEDGERDALLVFVERAMNSKTPDHQELKRRFQLALALAGSLVATAREAVDLKTDLFGDSELNGEKRSMLRAHDRLKTATSMSLSGQSFCIADFLLTIGSISYELRIRGDKYAPTFRERIKSLAVKALDDMLPPQSSIDSTPLILAKELAAKAYSLSDTLETV